MKTSHLKWFWSMQNTNEKTTSGEKNQVMHTSPCKRKTFQKDRKSKVFESPQAAAEGLRKLW